MSSLVEKVQDFLEADFRRPLTPAELKVVRKFSTDFNNAAQLYPEPKQTKAHGQVVSEPWRPQADPSKTGDGDIKPILKAESKLFNRVDAWAQMASAQAVTSPRSGGKDKPDDLDVDVGMKDRLGKWKSAEENPGESRGDSSARKPADLEVEVGMKDRLGKWKTAEEGKSDAAPAARKEPVRVHDDAPVEDVRARLQRWNTVTSEKPASTDKKAPVKTIEVHEKDSEEPTVHEVAPLRDRLASYQQTVDEKAAKAERDAKAEIGSAPGVNDRKNKWNEATGDKQFGASDAHKEETMSAAPKLKDRMHAYNKVTEDKPLEKATVVVPYDDGYEAPAAPQEQTSAPGPRKDPVKLEAGMSLKERMNVYNKVTEEKPIEKAPINIDYEDGYVPPPQGSQ